MKEVVWCFTYIKETTLRDNYKEVYKLWRERNPVARINLDAKELLNQKNYILKAQRLTAVEIDEIRENIRLELEGMKKEKPSIVRIRCLKKTLKNFTETWA